MDALPSQSVRLPWRSDRHFDWIKTGVAGWCGEGNIDAMATAILHMPKGAVVEIGSFVGQSACVIARLLELARSDAAFFTVDDWIFEGYKAGGIVSPHVRHDSWREHTERLFRVNVEYFTARRPHHMKYRSDRFFSMWAENAVVRDLWWRPTQLGGPIAFAFIDGDHSYEGCKRDVENTLRFLVPGGFILMDDSYEGTRHESAVVAKEMTAWPSLELAGRFPNLLFRRKVSDERSAP